MKSSLRGIVLLLVAALVLMVLADGCGQKKSGGVDNSPVKIGVIYSVSGASTSVGVEEKRSADLAAEEINAAGGISGHPVSLIYENDDSNSEKAVAAAKKLAYNDQVDAIIGPITSSGIAAAKSVTESAKVPELSITGSSPSLTANNPQWYFRNALSSAFQTKKMVKYCVETLGYKKFAILYDAARATDQYQGFAKDLADANIKPVAVEKFQTGDTSFNAQLLKIKAAQPDALLVLGMITESASAAKQARDLGIQSRVLGVVALAYDDYIKLAGSASEGTIACTTFLSSNPNPKTQEFVKKYQAKYNELPDHSAAQTYDAMNLIAQAVANGKLSFTDTAADRQKIRDELLKVNNYQGVASPITYGQGVRDAYTNPMLVEVKNGKWEIIE